MIYPWQQKAWQQVKQSFERLPNAWLIHGPENIGKTAFAREIAHALLCENRQKGEACGHCPSCQLISQKSHMDFCEITPIADDDSPSIESSVRDGEFRRSLTEIKKGAITALTSEQNPARITLPPQRGAHHVVLIRFAETLNVFAANALLKILEEPPMDTLFLLVSNHPERLLPTIRSRCRFLPLFKPTHLEALDFLKNKNVPDIEQTLAFYGGAPLFECDEKSYQLRAQLVDLLQQPRLLAILNFAQVYADSKQPLSRFLDSLNKWLIDLLLSQAGLPCVYFPQMKISFKIDLWALHQLQQKLFTQISQGENSRDVTLAVECMLLDYLQFSLKG